MCNPLEWLSSQDYLELDTCNIVTAYDLVVRLCPNVCVHTCFCIRSLPRKSKCPQSQTFGITQRTHTQKQTENFSFHQHVNDKNPVQQMTHMHRRTHTYITPHNPLLCWLCSCLPLRSGTPDDWRPRYGLLLPHFLLSSAIPSSPTSSPPHSQLPVSLPHFITTWRGRKLSL